MLIKRPCREVSIVRDFWSDCQCREFLRAAESYHTWVPGASSRPSVEILDLARTTLPNPVGDSLRLVNEQFAPAASHVSGALVSRYRPGSFVPVHVDTAASRSRRIATLILYLNDAYAGGELYFPDIGLEYRPEGGSLIIFFSRLAHGVRPILEGMRYCAVAFAEAHSIEWN